MADFQSAQNCLAITVLVTVSANVCLGLLVCLCSRGTHHTGTFSMSYSTLHDMTDPYFQLFP